MREIVNSNQILGNIHARATEKRAVRIKAGSQFQPLSISARPWVRRRSEVSLEFDTVVLGVRSAGGYAAARELAQARQLRGRVLVVDPFDSSRKGVFLNTLFQGYGTQALLNWALDHQIVGGHPNFFDAHREASRELLRTQRTGEDFLLNWQRGGHLQIAIGRGAFSGPYLDGMHCLRITPTETDDSGRLKKPFSVRAKNVVLATGSKPKRDIIDTLPRTGNRERKITIDYPEQFLRRPRHANHVVIIGAGDTGLEIASMLLAFGKKITLIHDKAEILPDIDRDIAKSVAAKFHRRGNRLLMQAMIEGFERNAHQNTRIKLRYYNHEQRSMVDEVLEAPEIIAATGRRPMLDELGLEYYDIDTSLPGLSVGESFGVRDRSGASIPGLYAIGDLPRERFHAQMEDESPGKQAGHAIEVKEVLNLKSADTARDHALLACAAILGQPPPIRFSGDHHIKFLHSIPPIAYFGPQRPDREVAFAVDVRYAELPTHSRLLPKDGLLRVYYDRETGLVTSAIGLGEHALDVVPQVLDLRQKLRAGNTLAYQGYSPVLRDLVRRAAQVYKDERRDPKDVSLRVLPEDPPQG